MLTVAAVLLALLALRWLLAQLRSDRTGTLDLEPDRHKGVSANRRAGRVTGMAGRAPAVAAVLARS